MASESAHPGESHLEPQHAAPGAQGEFDPRASALPPVKHSLHQRSPEMSTSRMYEAALKKHTYWEKVTPHVTCQNIRMTTVPVSAKAEEDHATAFTCVLKQSQIEPS